MTKRKGTFELSRRMMIGAATAPFSVTALPLAGPARGAAPVGAADIPAQCADWIALDLEIDRIGRRWGELEHIAVHKFDCFNLTDHQISALPVGAEMDALDAELRRLHRVRERALGPLAKLTPASVQAASAQLAIAYRILSFECGDSWPFVRNAWTFLSRSCCPGCGAAYAPADLLPV
jgi:hypothetical protein